MASKSLIEPAWKAQLNSQEARLTLMEKQVCMSRLIHLVVEVNERFAALESKAGGIFLAFSCIFLREVMLQVARIEANEDQHYTEAPGFPGCGHVWILVGRSLS